MSALSNRDPNTQSPFTNQSQSEKQAHAGAENKVDSFQKKMFEQKKDSENGQDGTYISPSDAIMSPASQKLVSFKQRQINKSQNGKNQTSRLLFARTPSGISGGDDVEAGSEKAGGQ